ncbi:MAG: hypothetical protein GY711_35650 [bacterium]|nr:hypothetical protein [bacterium]
MNLFIPGPEGRLEAILWTPPTDAPPPRAAVVVCHPHPAHGGTMRNNVVYRVARGLAEAGLVVVRFNFRGTGLSAGVHDGAGAEDGDLVAVLDWMAREHPELELWAAGFSFGARTVASVASCYPRILRALLVALPVSAYPCEFASELEGPGLVLMAGADEFGSLAVLEERFPELADAFETHEIEGADHFFKGFLPDVQAYVRAWAERSLETSSST